MDTKWFELYCSDPKAEFLERYWSSAPFNGAPPNWEYLVDGVIEVDDPASLEHWLIWFLLAAWRLTVWRTGRARKRRPQHIGEALGGLPWRKQI